MTGTTGVVSISDVLTTVDYTIVSSNMSIQGEGHVHCGREGPQCEQR